MIIEAIVVGFDEARGDGVVRDERGREFSFHCVNIADGTRRIDAGALVRARRAVGLRGRDEVVDLVKL
ncbi:MAG: hypothetical protein PXZ08_01055 [Actinomycetota bacterium]|nr:hypothetical protein [Actinomycetota bacterium]